MALPTFFNRLSSTKEWVKEKFSHLPTSEKVSVVALLFLLLILPLLIIASLNQVILNKRAYYPITPPVTPPYISPTPTPALPLNPVAWKTEQVSLQADDFYITANGQKYYAKGGPVSVHSDPGNSTYTTLELHWQENGKEMRLYLYFKADSTYWWSPEIRTYNGKQPGDWITYTGGLFFRNWLGYTYSAPSWNLYSDMNNPELNNIHFGNLKIQAFLNRSLPITPTSTIILKPTSTPTPVTCQTKTISQTTGTLKYTFNSEWKHFVSFKTPVSPANIYKVSKVSIMAGNWGNAQRSVTCKITDATDIKNISPQKTSSSFTAISGAAWRIMTFSPTISLAGNTEYRLYCKGPDSWGSLYWIYSGSKSNKTYKIEGCAQ